MIAQRFKLQTTKSQVYGIDVAFKYRIHGEK